MTDDRYNGWTNRETWAVKLHWDNTYGDYLFFSELAKEYFTRGDAVYVFADRLKEEYDQIKESVFDGEATKEAKMMVQDVGSDWRVEWVEIANAYYDEFREEKKVVVK